MAKCHREEGPEHDNHQHDITVRSKRDGRRARPGRKYDMCELVFLVIKQPACCLAQVRHGEEWEEWEAC